MDNIVFCLENNSNLNHETKETIINIISVYNKFLSDVNCPINEENLSFILSNITISEEETSDIKYDSTNNKIIVPDTKKYNYKVNEEKLNYMFIKTMLSVITTIHHQDSTITNGVIFSNNNKKYGEVINEVISDRILELTFGNPDYIVEQSPKAIGFKDELFRNLEEIYGSEKLLNYYLNGKGIELYSTMAQMFDSEEKALNLISLMDEASKIEPNDIEKAFQLRKYEYDIYNDIEFLKNVSKNNKISRVA